MQALHPLSPFLSKNCQSSFSGKYSRPFPPTAPKRLSSVLLSSSIDHPATVLDFWLFLKTNKKIKYLKINLQETIRKHLPERSIQKKTKVFLTPCLPIKQTPKQHKNPNTSVFSIVKIKLLLVRRFLSFFFFAVFPT